VANVAYIGVGNMGQAKILRLLGAGHSVVAYNRTVEKTRAVKDAGAKIAATPAAAVEGADVVMVSVTNDEASRAVWTGPDGVLSGAPRNRALLAECSTLSHDWVLELAGIVRGRGLRFIDLPVAGRPDAAEAGELRVYAGCSEEDLDELRPVLAAFSKKIFHFGPAGAGTAYKLIYNLLGVIQVASLAEAMVQCEAAGIDLEVAAEAFTLGYTGSRHVASHAAVMAKGKRNQPVGFSGRGRLKDSQYGVQLAEKLGRQARVGTAASAVFAQMVDIGMGEFNDSELIDALRAIAEKRAVK
jgi:3-hydroxyisobutyrate dehydrogenase